ncbi:hypothetical protein AOLI_G00268650 [Acnodon oligacanthus]
MKSEAKDEMDRIPHLQSDNYAVLGRKDKGKPVCPCLAGCEEQPRGGSRCVSRIAFRTAQTRRLVGAELAQLTAHQDRVRYCRRLERREEREEETADGTR